MTRLRTTYSLPEEGNEVEKVELTYPTLPPVVEADIHTSRGKGTTDQKVAGKEFDESKASDLIDDLIDIRWRKTR